MPYPLALTEVPINSRDLERCLTTIANEKRVPTRINIVYCRDREHAIKQSLESYSTVVIGRRTRWFFDKTARMVDRLTKLGHQVIRGQEREGD